MKNRFIYIIAVLFSLTAMSSCSDWLDKRPDDQLDITTAFENSRNLSRWLAYIYDGIPACYADSNWDAIADDANTPWDWTGVGNKTRNYLFGAWTPSDGQIIGSWAGLPKRIRSAYIFIENAHPLTDVSQKDIEIMKAECRFFIAYYHSILVMTYGSVPLIKEAVPTTSDENIMVKQRPFYEVVDWCANELEEVAKQLPLYYTDQAKDYGRATSLWALAMRARLLTFAASPLVNGNPEMSGVVNCDGEPIFTSKYDPYRWEDAAKANKELIDAAEENGYKLYEVQTVEGEHDPYMSYFGALMLRRDQGNYETIMPRTEEGAGWMDRKAAPRSIQGEAGVYGVTQNLVDAFFMANGIRPIIGYEADGKPIINAASGYTETGYSSADMKDNTAYFYNDPAGVTGRAQNVITTKGTFNMYCNREPRFYVSVMYNESFNWAKTHKDQSSTLPPAKKVNFFAEGEDGKAGVDYPTAGYLMKKRIAPDYLGSSSSGQFNKRHGVVYRLAEAYLSYAECLYEFSVSQGTFSEKKDEIFEYINLIRERAGIPEYGYDLAEPSQDDLRELIHLERRLELNCEAGIRWNDLRRWKEADTALSGPVYGMNMSAKASDRDSYYVRTKYRDERKFLSWWWPIPQDDIDRNLNLRQLPGW